MKRFLSSLLTLIMVIGIFTSVPITASAASVSDLTFELNSDGKSYTLKKGDKYTTGKLVIPSKYNGLPVTAIEDYAFDECETLTSVTIPNSVKSIGYSAFELCARLETVIIGDGVTYIGPEAFRKCGELSSLTLGKNIRTIEAQAFYYCEKITSITLPETLTTLGREAFSVCSSLNSIEILSNELNIAESAFYLTAFYKNDNNWQNNVLYIDDYLIEANVSGDYTVKANTKGIAAAAFEYNWDLSSVTIGENLAVIGKMAFANCESLTTFKIGNGIKIIDDEAFIFCKSLNTINFPETLQSIGKESFRGCNFTTISLPQSLKSIAYGAFMGCSNLSTINIPDTVRYIDQYAFQATAYVENIDNWDDKVLYVGNHLILVRTTMSGKLKIKQGTVSIADNAVYECSNLTSIVIPSSVKYIGDFAFHYCRSLTAVTFNDGLLEIGSNTFGWSKITKIVLPKTLKKLGENAFTYCESLSSIIVPKSVTSIGKKAFGYYNSTRDTLVRDFVAFVEKGSTGEKYAKDNGISYVLHPVFKSVENYSSGVKLSWSKATGADGYLVFRKTGSESFKKIAKITKNSTVSYIDKTAKSGVTYTYVIKTYSGSNISANSTELSIKVLSAPKLISVANNNAGIVVKWGKVAGANGYNVYRKIGSGKWNRIAIIKGNSTFAYTDKAVKAGTIYKYTVRAYNGSNLSAYNTAGLSIKRLLTPTLRSVVSTKSGITFKWNKVTGANGYLVYRKTGSGDWVKIATVKGNATVSYLDKTAKKGVTYAYTVKAYYSTSKSYHNDKGLKIKDKY